MRGNSVVGTVFWFTVIEGGDIEFPDLELEESKRRRTAARAASRALVAFSRVIPSNGTEGSDTVACTSG